MNVALLVVVCQALIVLLLLVCVRSFGTLSRAMIRTHESNRRIHAQNVLILQRLHEQQQPLTPDGI